MVAVRAETDRHPDRDPLRPFHAVHADSIGGVGFLRLGEASSGELTTVEGGLVTVKVVGRNSLGDHVIATARQVNGVEHVLIIAGTGVPTSGLILG